MRIPSGPFKGVPLRGPFLGIFVPSFFPGVWALQSRPRARQLLRKGTSKIGFRVLGCRVKGLGFRVLGF